MYINIYVYVIGKKRFIFPVPRDACSDIQNADKITEVDGRMDRYIDRYIFYMPTLTLTDTHTYIHSSIHTRMPSFRIWFS